LSPEFGKEYSLNEFLCCYYLVVSRQFSLPLGITHKICIVPYADMANTAPKKQENTDWQYDHKTNSFIFKAFTPIPKGAPV
jgi:hypothetical protein